MFIRCKDRYFQPNDQKQEQLFQQWGLVDAQADGAHDALFEQCHLFWRQQTALVQMVQNIAGLQVGTTYLRGSRKV